MKVWSLFAVTLLAVVVLCSQVSAQGRRGGVETGIDKSVEAKEIERERVKKAEQVERDAGKKAEEVERERVKKAEHVEREAGKKAEEVERERGKKAEEAEREAGKKAEEVERERGRKVSQMENEEIKHRERMAKLERLHEVMKEKENTEAVANVEEMIEKEKERHQRVLDRLADEDKEAAEAFEKKMKGVREQDQKREKERQDKRAQDRGRGGR